MTQISIVIPVYNAEKFLVETLECVKNQTFTDFECVIVNDGSTDKSLDIINSYANVDKRFKVITTPNSGCANIPRNIAIKNSLGEFIFNLDADDILDLDTLERLLFRQNETKADIVILRIIGCKKQLEGELWRLPLNTFDMNTVISGTEACDFTIGRWLIPGIGLFRRHLFENIHTGCFMNSDEIASRHLFYKAAKVAFEDSNYYYRNNTESITKSVSIKTFERILTDELLDNFISERFDIHSETCIKLRNTRLFNMIYLQYDFFKYKNQFSKEKQSEIANNFRTVYSTQNFAKLRNELPMALSILFASNYTLFKISSYLYVKFKDRNGRKYQPK